MANRSFSQFVEQEMGKFTHFVIVAGLFTDGNLPFSFPLNSTKKRPMTIILQGDLGGVGASLPPFLILE